MNTHTASATESEHNTVQWFLDRGSYFEGDLYLAGWAFHPESPVSIFYLDPQAQRIRVDRGVALPSPDVAAHYGEAASDCRFSFKISCPDAVTAKETRIVLMPARGEEITLTVQELGQRALGQDPYHRLLPKFLDALNQSSARSRGPTRILEIGSRNRSGNILRSLFGNLDYTGLDILAGENVDVVGDAHELSRLFPAQRFHAVFSASTFEHLLMPWKVALEMNRVLAPGALVFISTHQTWAIHDTPWDFWRFSDESWHALFNGATGYEVVDTALGEPGSIVAKMLNPATAGLEAQPAYLGSAAIVRKIGKPRRGLCWDLGVKEVVATRYPKTVKGVE